LFEAQRNRIVHGRLTAVGHIFARFGQTEFGVAMVVPLKKMRRAGTRLRPGAHDSSGMNFDKVWHAHDLHQLLYAFEGSVELDSLQSRFLVPPQLVAWIPAGVTHRTRIQGPRSGSVFLPPNWVKPAGDRIRILRASPLMREMVMEAMRWPIDQPENPTGRSYFKTFAALCREWIENEAPLCLPIADDPPLRRAMEYTLAHLADARFTEVCAAAHLSGRSLRRRFLQLAGMSWTEYRRRSRLMKAMTLLEKRNTSVTEIAARVGFDSVSAFSKAFGEFAGESPRRYRDRVGR
jgi:AraC-like DNA-binding protein